MLFTSKICSKFACFITYKRVVKTQRFSAADCSVNFLTMYHRDESVFEKLR